MSDDILREFTRLESLVFDGQEYKKVPVVHIDTDAMAAEIVRLRHLLRAIHSLDEWQLEYADDDGSLTDAMFCFTDEVKLYARQGLPKEPRP